MIEMNLELVEQTNFGEVEVDLYKNESNEVFMTINQLAKALEYSNKSAIENKLMRYEYLRDKEFSIIRKMVNPNNKENDTRLFTKKGINAIISLSHRPLTLKKRLVEIAGEDIKIHAHAKSRDEDEYIYLIQSSLKPFASQREVEIENYRVDLLFQDYDLVIECDEFGHQDYDQELEKNREDFLKRKGFEIYRFNPDVKDFYIGEIVGDILEIILEKEKNK